MQKILLSIIAAAVVTIGMTVNDSSATHEPADKTQGAANSIDEIDEDSVVLEETMKVSSVSDLIMSTSAECSILTSLYTEGGPPPEPSSDPNAPPPPPRTETDGSFGQVVMWLTIDGRPVPVESIGRSGDANTDDGKVVFCNRAYQRTVTDNEDERDGLDTEDDFIRTRTANAFNWMAFDVGKNYDALADGNNIVTIQLHAAFTKETSDGESGEAAECKRFDDSDPPVRLPRDTDDALVPYGDTCADAFVGKRSLIVEAVHASNHEQTAPVSDGGQTSSGGTTLPSLP